MNKSLNISIIENFPNEIFMEIFQYINVRDLHRAWSKLNKRFTSILCSIPMHAHLTEQNHYKIYKSCFRYYASQFLYIRIEQICDIPDTFDINHFSNIRSLHLGVVTYKQYDQITPKNMPYLTHLTINELQIHRNPVFLLFGLESFVNLLTCHLPYFFSTHIQLQICLTIRSLHLNFCSITIFFDQIKIFLPNLVYFKSNFGIISTNICIKDKSNMIIPHNNLNYLKIKLEGRTSLDFIESILTVTPELRYFELYCQYYCDCQHLAHLLRIKTPKLKQFSFYIKEYYSSHLPDVNILKDICPLFSQLKIEQYDNRKQIICNSKTN